MNCTDRPILDTSAEVAIESLTNQHNLNLWNSLQQMLALTPTAAELLRKAYPSRLHPPTSRMPNLLRQFVESYAFASFFSESVYFPGEDPCIEHWLKNLADRIVEKAMEIVKLVEESGQERRPPFSLAHHGLTLEDIGDTARRKLNELIRNRLTIPAPAPKDDGSSGASDHDTDEINRRNRLLIDYKAATGDPPDYRIYNAKNSGIHKPQFYQWKNGKLPRKSETALNFERFLCDKKPPIPRKTR
jgi:hypothetical protein